MGIFGGSTATGSNSTLFISFLHEHEGLVGRKGVTTRVDGICDRWWLSDVGGHLNEADRRGAMIGVVHTGRDSR